ncbi:MAG TPA: acetate--CoA ligase family protein [Ramlibacter sp.]|uniref:acetate--CoA ligase family protein n=1 Tax=Ramlibacter sp. TaxID=1917967 RepID=UPI002BCBBE67|nr:acetate--CoA ligase family protein [Ramlibacter sp.]HVZ46822.1 acetate--CoA ligase family protein [Ramlibacter sp.]
MLEIIREARAAHRKSLDEAQAKRLVAAFGVRVPRSTILREDADVDAAMSELRAPLVLKAMAPTLLHKSDAGGVRLRLDCASAVRDAMRDMRTDRRMAAHSVDAFLLEEMASSGHELVIGGRWDANFGPVAMLGLGGIFVEVFADVSFRLCPIERIDALEMIGELRGARVLEGARGGAVASRDAIVDALMAVGGADGLMLRAEGAIAELDLNPVIVDAARATAVDARVLLRVDA